MSETPDLIKPGSTTSEYKLSKWVVILCLVSTVCGTITATLPSFIEGMEGGTTLTVLGGKAAAQQIALARLKAQEKKDGNQAAGGDDGSGGSP